MDIYGTIESVLDASEGSNIGRTAIQKLIYLAHAKIPTLDIPQYKPHYYGPYSSDLSLALERLVTHHFIDETPGRLHEGYKYRLTPDGDEIVAELKEHSRDEYLKIKDIVNTCMNSCDLKASPLSCAAKVFFMQRNRPNSEGTMTVKEARKRAQGFGWNISSKDIEDGATVLCHLGLAKNIAN